MNILVFSWRGPKHPLAGGAEQVDHEHHKGWISKGHTVTLFSSSFPGAKRNEEIDKVKIVRYGNQILGVHIAAFFWYLFGTHNKFDLVIDEFHGLPFFTPLYVRAKKISVLQEVARGVWLKNDLHFPFNYLIGFLGYTFEPLIFILYKKTPFMVGSASAKKELCKVGISNQNINVIPHGVILDLPKRKVEKENTKTIVFLGALAKDKGIEDALKVFSILNKEEIYKFWIIGKAGINYSEELKRKSVNLGIIKNTKFWGFVPQKEKFELLAKAHILVNPSLIEGFGLVNIEANSVKTPVISYNSPGLTDSVKNDVSGIIIHENTPQEMAKIVRNVLENKNLYKTLQEGALSWSKNFTWEKSIKLSLALIEKVGIK